MTVNDSQASGPEPELPTGPLLRLPAVLLRVGVGRSQWLDLVWQKRAPERIKVGRSALWLQSEVDRWVLERVRQHRGGR